MTHEELAKIIKENPGAVLVLDNDDWWLHRKPGKPLVDMTDEEHDRWSSEKLAESYNFGQLARPYGGDFLRAAALALNIKVERV